MPCGTGQRGSGVGMDLKRLEYFCAIVEKGQISKAAEALHISQPPLSMRLKELEEELDVQLIYREGKAWQVTPEGEALYQRAQFILSYVAGLEKDIRESRNKVSGLVRIGVCPPCLSLASTPIPALNREFPDLRFRSGSWTTSPSNGTSRSGILTSRWSSFRCRTPTTPCPVGAAEFVAVYGQVPRRGTIHRR
ncbi:MAG: LysR family transcriptional regulator [Bilophila wadsworthia]